MKKTEFYCIRSSFPGFLHVVLLIAAAAAPAVSGSADLPHRKLSTRNFFSSMQELNHPLGAFFPDMTNLKRLAQLSDIIRKEAARRKINPETASKEFWEQLVKQLAENNHRAQLLASLEKFREQAKGKSRHLQLLKETKLLNQLSEALQNSPYREKIERIAMKSMARGLLNTAARKTRELNKENGLASYIEKFKDILNNAEVPPERIDQLRAVYHKTRSYGKSMLSWLSDLTSRSAQSAGKLPGISLPLVLILPALAVLFVAILLVKRKRIRSVHKPPPLNLRGLHDTREDFSRSLLCFYRRILFEARLPFRGRTMEELRRELLQVHPGLAAASEQLNSAFYDLYYAGEEKTGGELHSLNRLLKESADKTMKGSG